MVRHWTVNQKQNWRLVSNHFTTMNYYFQWIWISIFLWRVANYYRFDLYFFFLDRSKLTLTIIINGHSPVPIEPLIIHINGHSVIFVFVFKFRFSNDWNLNHFSYLIMRINMFESISTPCKMQLCALFAWMNRFQKCHYWPPGNGFIWIACFSEQRVK